VNAYKVKAGIGVIAGKTVWSIPECLQCEVLQNKRYINPLTYLPTYFRLPLLWFLLLFQSFIPLLDTIELQCTSCLYSCDFLLLFSKLKLDATFVDYTVSNLIVTMKKLQCFIFVVGIITVVQVSGFSAGATSGDLTVSNKRRQMACLLSRLAQQASRLECWATRQLCSMNCK